MFVGGPLVLVHVELVFEVACGSFCELKQLQALMKQNSLLWVDAQWQCVL
jgi:hypothetical protein